MISLSSEFFTSGKSCKSIKFKQIQCETKKITFYIKVIGDHSKCHLRIWFNRRLLLWHAVLFSHASPSPSLSLDPTARYCWRPEHVKNKVIVSNKDQNKQTFQVSSPSPIHLSPSPYSLLYQREQSATRDSGSGVPGCETHVENF